MLPRRKDGARSASREQVLLFALLCPLVLYDLGLSAVRLIGHWDEILREPFRVGPLDWLGMFASPLLFHFGLCLFASGALLLAARARVRAVVLVWLQVLCGAIAFSNTAAHVYFLQTSTALDWSKALGHALRPADLALAASGSVTEQEWILLAFILVVVAAAPWIASSAHLRMRGPLLRQGTPRLAALVLAMNGVGVAALGVLPWGEVPVDRDVLRDPVLHFFFTGLETARENRTYATAAARAAQPFDLRIERERPVPKLNVAIVILESTRASSTTLMKPQRDTTPFLAELGERSLVVDRAYSIIPHTSKALVAILCGVEPSHNEQPTGISLTLLSRCLPRLLAEQGYRTVFFQAASKTFEQRVPTTQSMGFKTFIGSDQFDVRGFQRANWLGYEDDVMLEPSRAWLASHKGKPIFATYLTVNAHHEVEPLTRHGFRDFDPRPDVNRYENAVRADDFFLQALIEQWKAAGLYENTLFVVVGDHGEAFGEHGLRTHDKVPYEEVLRVPMLLHDPSGKYIPPGRQMLRSSQLDIAPTLVEALGYRVTRGSFPGVPLALVRHGRKLKASCDGESNCLVEWDHGAKLIHNFDRKPDEYYDLHKDPSEKHNVLKDNPGHAAQMLEEVLSWDRRVHALYWGEELRASRSP